MHARNTPSRPASRRSFLKAMLIAGAAPCFVPARVFGATAPSNQITVGVIGVGAQGTGDMRNFLSQDDVRVTAMRSRELANRPPLQIVGPADDLPVVVELSRRFLQADRFPTVWPKVELRPLEPGQTYETDRFKIETVKALHPVTGFCSRFTDKATGAVIAFSGDTNPNPALAKLARGADVLIHEASIGPTTPDDKIGKDHSRAVDAARIAKEAGVKQLVLVHLSTRQKDASLGAAQKIFANTILGAEGQTLIFPRKISSR